MGFFEQPQPKEYDDASAQSSISLISRKFSDFRKLSYQSGPLLRKVDAVAECFA